MTVEVMGTAVGLLVIVLDNVYDPGVFTDDITAVLILVLILLCGAYLSQCFTTDAVTPGVLLTSHTIPAIAVIVHQYVGQKESRL